MKGCERVEWEKKRGNGGNEQINKEIFCVIGTKNIVLFPECNKKIIKKLSNIFLKPFSFITQKNHLTAFCYLISI